VVGWVFFRAANFDAAIAILKSMVGLNGFDLPPGIAGARALGFISLAGGVALFAPNVFEMFHRQLGAEMNSRVPHRPTSILWKPNAVWAVVTGGMLAYCLLSLSEPSEFLYFQF
jgi:hypothetical protein